LGQPTFALAEPYIATKTSTDPGEWRRDKRIDILDFA